MVLDMLTDNDGVPFYQKHLNDHWADAATAAFTQPPAALIEALQHKPTKGLYIVGTVGTGKTWMLASTFRYLAETFPMHTTGIVPWLGFLKALKGDFDRAENERQEAHYYEHLDFLLIDDFGKGNRTPWAIEQMYTIVEARLRMRRTTFFTSNYPLRQVADWGDDGEAIASRIRGLCNVLELNGEDRRLSK